MLAVADKIKLRAAVNEWVSETFPQHRKYLSHTQPEYCEKRNTWIVSLETKNVNGHSFEFGYLLVDDDGTIFSEVSPSRITRELNKLLVSSRTDAGIEDCLQGELYDFRLGDGIKGAELFRDGEVDLLLTDPPYGISSPYTCEKQVPRRLRKNGADFIMPKGHFGQWDDDFKSGEWADIVLPKVGGWVVIFCAQAQIGEYSGYLKMHGFNAVGTLVWQKTNPVPFNHKYKPINAWEALVVGKRPGTKFNGKVVHNVFLYKSPSPQQRIHPTQKPLPLIEKFVELFSNEGDFIYDPFAGSATTLIAATKLGRKSIAYEKDLTYYKSACERIQKDVKC